MCLGRELQQRNPRLGPPDELRASIPRAEEECYYAGDDVDRCADTRYHSTSTEDMLGQLLFGRQDNLSQRLQAMSSQEKQAKSA